MEEERLQYYSANAQKETQVERAMQHIFMPLAGHFMGLAGGADPRVFDPEKKKNLRAIPLILQSRVYNLQKIDYKNAFY